MKKYRIIIEKLAEKDFHILKEKPDKERVLRAIHELPAGNDIKRLKGRKSMGLYRLRVGDYRIIYKVNNNELIICAIDAGNRGQIYSKY